MHEAEPAQQALGWCSTVLQGKEAEETTSDEVQGKDVKGSQLLVKKCSKNLSLSNPTLKIGDDSKII